MSIGIPKEATPGEKRVSIIPAHATKLIKKGFKIFVESSAG